MLQNANRQVKLFETHCFTTFITALCDIFLMKFLSCYGYFRPFHSNLGAKIRLFLPAKTEVGPHEEKLCPRSQVWPGLLPLGHTRDLWHSFSQYGSLGLLITYVFHGILRFPWLVVCDYRFQKLLSTKVHAAIRLRLGLEILHLDATATRVVYKWQIELIRVKCGCPVK